MAARSASLTTSLSGTPSRTTADHAVGRCDDVDRAEIGQRQDPDIRPVVTVIGRAAAERVGRSARCGIDVRPLLQEAGFADHAVRRKTQLETRGGAGEKPAGQHELPRSLPA